MHEHLIVRRLLRNAHRLLQRLVRLAGVAEAGVHGAQRKEGALEAADPEVAGGQPRCSVHLRQHTCAAGRQMRVRGGRAAAQRCPVGAHGSLPWALPACGVVKVAVQRRGGRRRVARLKRRDVLHQVHLGHVTRHRRHLFQLRGDRAGLAPPRQPVSFNHPLVKQPLQTGHIPQAHIALGWPLVVLAPDRDVVLYVLPHITPQATQTLEW
mmetsp:Transcript_16401/g.29239  ORF Transcript_16401/g.29239 Transcript_16401/m.29239 type:complete len:210 (+) Transcript_16401:1040-1669(+)